MKLMILAFAMVTASSLANAFDFTPDAEYVFQKRNKSLCQLAEQGLRFKGVPDTQFEMSRLRSLQTPEELDLEIAKFGLSRNNSSILRSCILAID